MATSKRGGKHGVPRGKGDIISAATYGAGDEDGLELLHLCLKPLRPEVEGLRQEKEEKIVTYSNKGIDVLQHELAKVGARDRGRDIRVFYKGIELKRGRKFFTYNIPAGTPRKPTELTYMDACSSFAYENTAVGIYADTHTFHVAKLLPMKSALEAVQIAFQAGVKPELTLDGTGGTYMLKDSNKRVRAVFKPKDEEAFAPRNPRNLVKPEESPSFRAGVYSTLQAAREVAAYLLDHKSLAGVPTTTMVHAKHTAFHNIDDQGNQTPPLWKTGSLQLWQDDCELAGDYAPSKFDPRDVRAMAMLDIRIINLDRNDSNILVNRRAGKRYKLVPIDHGLSLPDVLEVAEDDIVWMSWPQVKEPFTTDELAYIHSISAEKDAKLIEKRLGVHRTQSRLMECSTRLLQIGAQSGLTLEQIGKILYRDDFDVPSVMEKIIRFAVEGAFLGDPRLVCDHSLLSALDLRSATQRSGHDFSPKTRSKGRLETIAESQTANDSDAEPAAPITRTASVASNPDEDAPAQPADRIVRGTRGTTGRRHIKGDVSIRKTIFTKLMNDPQGEGKKRFVELEWTEEIEQRFKRIVVDQLQRQCNKVATKVHAHPPAASEEESEDDTGPLQRSRAVRVEAPSEDDGFPKRSAGGYVPPAQRRAQQEAAAAAAAVAVEAPAPAKETNDAQDSAAPEEVMPPRTQKAWVPRRLRDAQGGEAKPPPAPEPPKEGLPPHSRGGDQHAGWSLHQGRRKAQEDAVQTRSAGMLSTGYPSGLYAVYDGHGGVEAVEFVQQALPVRFNEKKAEGKCTADALREAFEELDDDLLAVLRAGVPAPRETIAEGAALTRVGRSFFDTGPR
mmetsp:Transcript_87363/g.233904  ORF Transcript_87363/g.233904 Transcript_87363/m.233904 type:complete len:842 (-) Transcript_87363:667-3192(-)